MRVDVKVKQEVNIQSVKVHCKVRDEGTYTLHDSDGREVCTKEGYVPSFFPGDHYGDYLILDIDLESGKILNWKDIDPYQIKEFVEGCDE